MTLHTEETLRTVDDRIVGMETPINISYWMTPGSVLADRISTIEEVVLVATRFEDGLHHIFVGLTRDPAHILKEIYDSEGEVFKAFPRARIDLRVSVVQEHESPALLREGIVHFNRLGP